MALVETWEIDYPEAAATGLLVARGRLDPTIVLWVHAAPPTLSARVRQSDGRIVASGESLRRAGQRYPMTRLERQGDRIVRQDRWPTEVDLGAR